MGMEYKPLYELLASGRFSRVKLSKTAVKRLLKESGFLERLPGELGSRRVHSPGSWGAAASAAPRCWTGVGP